MRWVKGRKGVAAMIPLSLLLLVATVSASHAAARMDNRWLLATATAIHHLGTAAWIGAMPFLLISLPRAGSVEEARALARRYSSMALLSVAALVLAGVYLAWSYVGTWNGLYGTSYGVLLLAKIYLLLVMLLMGAGNWLVVRRLDTDPLPLLAKLRRFAEAEVGLGFTDHSGCCFDVCATAGGRRPQSGLAPGNCRPHAPRKFRALRAHPFRSLPRPPPSKRKSRWRSTTPPAAAMIPIGNGRNITITGQV